MSHILLCLRAEQRKHIPFLLRSKITSIYMPILHPSLHCIQAHPILNILFTVALLPATGWPCIFNPSLEILKWTPLSTSVRQWHINLNAPCSTPSISNKDQSCPQPWLLKANTSVKPSTKGHSCSVTQQSSEAKKPYLGSDSTGLWNPTVYMDLSFSRYL